MNDVAIVRRPWRRTLIDLQTHARNNASKFSRYGPFAKKNSEIC